MKILCAGLNHETAPLEVRQCLAFDDDAARDALAELRRRYGDAEFVILSTCNRVEVYCAAPAAGPPGCRELLGQLAAVRDQSSEGLAPHAYCLETADAVRHVMEVAASLDSMVVGESQILGQAKAAFLRAAEAGATGKYLNRLFHQALHAAKRVHGATGIGRRRTSVAGVAVDFASRIFSGLAAKRVLLIGAGEMALRAAEQLKSVGCGRLAVVNRTAARADELARQFAARSRPWDELDEALADSDIVIASTASPEPILTADRLRRLHRRRGWANWLILDLAVPRDVETAAGSLQNVYLYDTDALGRVVSDNLALRHEEAEAAAAIIADEVRAYLDWLEVRDVGPVVARLEERLHALGDEEVERLMKRLGDALPESTANEIRLATHRIVHKLLHEPIETLKADARDGRHRATLQALKRLFRLDE